MVTLFKPVLGVPLLNGLFRPGSDVGLVPGAHQDDDLHIRFPEDLPGHQHSSPLSIMFMGRRGAGKSLSMTAIAKFMNDAYRVKRSPMRVVTNYHVNFAIYSSPILVDELNEFPSWGRQLLVCLDEIAAYFPGRRSLARTNVDFSTFLQQIRKRRIEFMMTTQFPQMLDNQLLMQIDLFIDVDYHRWGCGHFAGHRHCVDLYIHDWWGQWTGRNFRKPFPPYRDDNDWMMTLHKIGSVFQMYDTEEVVAPIWSDHRESIIRQGWGEAYVDEEIKEEDEAALRPPATLPEFLARLDYQGDGFKIKDALGEAGLFERSVVNLATFYAWLKAHGWEIDDSDRRTPMARRVAL